MLMPFKFGLGGPVSPGSQGFSEQLELYQNDEDAFWENYEMVEELEENMEFVRDKDGGTDYRIEE